MPILLKLRSRQMPQVPQSPNTLASFHAKDSSANYLLAIASRITRHSPILPRLPKEILTPQMHPLSRFLLQKHMLSLQTDWRCIFESQKARFTAKMGSTISWAKLLRSIPHFGCKLATYISFCHEPERPLDFFSTN